MTSTALGAEPPSSADRDADGRAGRRSPVPDAPSYSRRELEVFDEVEGALGFVLWRVISDVLVWARAAPGERAGLLSGGGTPAGLLEEGLALAEPVVGDLRALAALDGTSDPERVAAACARAAGWAEGAGMKGVALQFAELAAWAQPESSAFAWSAGRLCRRMGEFERAKLWLRRSLRLARRSGNEIDFANAHRGFGFVLADQGRFDEAEPHFWKSVRAALRVGRRSLAGAAYHDLLMVAVNLSRWSDAVDFGERAVRLYRAASPNFPKLAHDVAFFCCRRGYFSSALPIFEEVVERMPDGYDRILAYASIARSSAAVHDNIRFQRAAARVEKLASQDSEMAASSLYHVAEGARSFGDWTRAQKLCSLALESAEQRQDATIARLAADLMKAIEARSPGDVDTVPEEGDPIDLLRITLLRKLRRQPRLTPVPRPDGRSTP